MSHAEAPGRRVETPGVVRAPPRRPRPPGRKAGEWCGCGGRRRRSSSSRVDDLATRKKAEITRKTRRSSRSSKFCFDDLQGPGRSGGTRQPQRTQGKPSCFRRSSAASNPSPAFGRNQDVLEQRIHTNDTNFPGVFLPLDSCDWCPSLFLCPFRLRTYIRYGVKATPSCFRPRPLVPGLLVVRGTVFLVLSDLMTVPQRPPPTARGSPNNLLPHAAEPPLLLLLPRGTPCPWEHRPIAPPHLLLPVGLLQVPHAIHASPV